MDGWTEFSPLDRSCSLVQTYPSFVKAKGECRLLFLIDYFGFYWHLKVSYSFKIIHVVLSLCCASVHSTTISQSSFSSSRNNDPRPGKEGSLSLLLLRFLQRNHQSQGKQKANFPFGRLEVSPSGPPPGVTGSDLQHLACPFHFQVCGLRFGICV